MGVILAHRGAPPEAIQKRSEEWRPAAVGSQPLVSGGIKRVYARRNALGGPARQALRPGCEELAARIRRKCRRRKRGPRPKIATVERHPRSGWIKKPGRNSRRGNQKGCSNGWGHGQGN